MTLSVTGLSRMYLGWCPNAPCRVRTPQPVRSQETVTGIIPDGPGGTSVKPVPEDRAILVPVTAAACLFFLTVALKNVLLIPAGQLTQDIIIWIIIYMGFIFTYPPVTCRSAPGAPVRHPVLWCILIVVTTLAIIGVYAL